MVRKGDTLQGLAAGLYGDASLWYKIAEVNGLSGQTALIEGQSLTLPAGVIRNTNNATTFQPYDPASTIGDTSPTAAAAPPKKKGCGVVGQIIVAVVAFAIDRVLPGAGTAIGNMFRAAAIATTVQVAAIAAGIQEKFDPKAVALAAINGGIDTADFGASKAGGPWKESTPDWLRAAKVDALKSAARTGALLVTGIQPKLNFAGVAAAYMGPWIGNAAANGLGVMGVTGKAAAYLTNGAVAIASAATKSLVDGTDFGDNIRAQLPSVVAPVIFDGLMAAGSAIGSAMVDRRAERAQTALAPPPSVANMVAQEMAMVVNPLVIQGGALNNPSYAPLTFDPLNLALGNGDLSGQTLSSVRSRVNAWNSLMGEGNQVLWSQSAFNGKSIGAGQSMSFATTDAITGEMVGRNTLSALDGANPGRIQALQFRYAGARGATSIFATSGGVALYAGGDVSFGDLGIRVNNQRLSGSGKSGPPDIIVNESAEFKAELRRVSAENGAILGRFLGDQIPGLGTGLAINDYRQNPTLLNGVMVGISLAPFAGTLSGLAKTSKTFNVAWEIPAEALQTNLAVIHGNSQLSTKTATLYRLTQEDGTFLKYGISQNYTKRYSGKFMEDKRIFRVTEGTRADMLTLEREMVTQNPGPINFEPWAVKTRKGMVK